MVFKVSLYSVAGHLDLNAVSLCGPSGEEAVKASLPEPIFAHLHTLKTHTPQIQGVKISPPELRE